MNPSMPYSPYQFALFRWLVGVYLALHFGLRIPAASEWLEAGGVVPRVGGPLVASVVLGLSATAALMLAAGVLRGPAALVSAVGWISLYGGAMGGQHPAPFYVGFLLILIAAVPPGEGLRPGSFTPRADWIMPPPIRRFAFFALMAAYTWSGLAALGGPPGLWGDASEVIGGSSAVPAEVIRLALVAPAVALPLCAWRRGRFVAWAAMLALQGFLWLAADLGGWALGMVLAHGLVFDPGWLPARTGGRRIVFFDGVCALCDTSVRFMIREDAGRIFRYAPLQGTTAEREPALRALDEGDDEAPASVVYLRGDGDDRELLTHSDAVVAVLDDLGGFWRLMSIGRIVPRPLRDALYRLVARHRYRWFGRFDACRLPTPGEADLFLD